MVGPCVMLPSDDICHAARWLVNMSWCRSNHVFFHLYCFVSKTYLYWDLSCLSYKHACLHSVDLFPSYRLVTSQCTFSGICYGQVSWTGVPWACLSVQSSHLLQGHSSTEGEALSDLISSLILVWEPLMAVTYDDNESFERFSVLYTGIWRRYYV